MSSFLGAKATLPPCLLSSEQSFIDLFNITFFKSLFKILSTEEGIFIGGYEVS